MITEASAAATWRYTTDFNLRLYHPTCSLQDSKSALLCCVASSLPPLVFALLRLPRWPPPVRTTDFFFRGRYITVPLHSPQTPFSLARTVLFVSFFCPEKDDDDYVATTTLRVWDTVPVPRLCLETSSLQNCAPPVPDPADDSVAATTLRVWEWDTAPVP